MEVKATARYIVMINDGASVEYTMEGSAIFEDTTELGLLVSESINRQITYYEKLYKERVKVVEEEQAHKIAVLKEVQNAQATMGQISEADLSKIKKALGSNE